jgi:hypothetical protein
LQIIASGFIYKISNLQILFNFEFSKFGYRQGTVFDLYDWIGMLTCVIFSISFDISFEAVKVLPCEKCQQCNITTENQKAKLKESGKMKCRMLL